MPLDGRIDHLWELHLVFRRLRQHVSILLLVVPSLVHDSVEIAVVTAARDELTHLREHRAEEQHALLLFANRVQILLPVAFEFDLQIVAVGLQTFVLQPFVLELTDGEMQLKNRRSRRER